MAHGYGQHHGTSSAEPDSLVPPERQRPIVGRGQRPTCFGHSTGTLSGDHMPQETHSHHEDEEGFLTRTYVREYSRRRGRAGVAGYV